MSSSRTPTDLKRHCEGPATETSSLSTVITPAPTPSGNGSAVTGYRVYRSTSSGNESLYTIIPAINAFTDSNLTNGTTYYYKLTALNAVGTWYRPDGPRSPAELADAYADLSLRSLSGDPA